MSKAEVSSARIVIDAEPGPDKPVDGDELQWTDVTLTLHVGGSVLRRRPPTPKHVLCGVGGTLAPGELLAIMGPSGSGKSSLLSVLAGRVPGSPHTLSGLVTCGGTRASKAVRRGWGFVFQDDLLLSNLSVRETIHFSAMLRLPQTLSPEARAERVTATLRQLRLLECADTLIGSEAKRGVSGGERKRCAIGVELVSRPRMLFLDEPTSGLDAATALLLVSLLSDLARDGAMQVLCSVHQPRSNIYRAFHKLLLLSRGTAVYSGALSDAVPYFEAAAGVPLPPLTNPADWLIDLIDADAVSVTANTAVSTPGGDAAPPAPAGYADTPKPAWRGLQGMLSREPATRTVRRWQTSSLWQFRVLLSRSTRQQRGDVFNFVNIFQILAVAVVVCAVWHGHKRAADRLGLLFFVNINQAFNTQNTVLRLFPAERALFRRERLGGAYRVLPYFLAKSLSDGVAIFVLPMIYSSVIYWATGLRQEAAAFGRYLVLALALVTAAHSYGLLMSVAFRTVALANSVAFVLILLLLIFAGFYMELDQLPPWCAWVRYLSYLYWGFSGMLVNEFSGRELPCEAQRPGEYAVQCPFSGDLVLEAHSMGEATVGWSLFALLLMSLLFRVAAYLCLRFELVIG